MNKNLLKRIVLTSAIAVLGVSTSFAALVMERDQSVDTGMLSVPGKAEDRDSVYHRLKKKYPEATGP